MVIITYPMPIASPTVTTIRTITVYKGQITLPRNLNRIPDKYLTGSRKSEITLNESTLSEPTEKVYNVVAGNRVV